MICTQVFIILLVLLSIQTSLSSGKALSNTIWAKFRNSSVKSPSDTELDLNGPRKDLIINGISGKITNRDWRRQVTQVKWPTNEWLSDLPTNIIRSRLFCRTGYYLQIRRNGAVSGTPNQNSKYTIFELQSFGPSIIRIKSVATNYYLVMKKNGLFTGNKQSGTLRSLFRETHEYNAFNSYASVNYFHKTPYDMYIGIKHNRKMKRAMKTHRNQNATQFLVIKV